MTTTSIADQVSAAFNFTVDKYRLRGPDGQHTPHFGLFRSDTGACIGTAVREGYEPHTRDDVIALAEAAASAFGGDGAEVRTYFDDGHFLTVAPTREHRAAIFGTKDNVFPRLTIRAPYDGHAFWGDLGMYRDACRNLSIARAVDGQQFGQRIIHRASLRGEMDHLRNVFGRIESHWEEAVAMARSLEARTVKMADFLREVYPAPADDASRRTRDSHARRIEKIIVRLMRERMQTGRPGNSYEQATAWEAYNAVQGYVQHDATRRGNPSPIARAAMAINDAAVARALTLALAS